MKGRVLFLPFRCLDHIFLYILKKMVYRIILSSYCLYMLLYII